HPEVGEEWALRAPPDEIRFPSARAAGHEPDQDNTRRGPGDAHDARPYLPKRRGRLIRGIHGGEQRTSDPAERVRSYPRFAESARASHRTRVRPIRAYAVH